MSRVGSLCSGYGGLELGLSELFDVDLAWVSDIDKGANKILAHRHPGVPNLGDFTTVDWRKVEPVDVICAGFPCQPVSHAGKRAGTDDERWLFDDITSAVGLLDPRPRLLVFENVLGLLSANRGHAMARVVHGLAQIGYVGRYRVLRAADVGAPHGRARVFIVAYPEHDGLSAAAFGRGAGARAGGGRLLEPQGSPAGPRLMSTPQSRDYKGVPSDGFNQANLARDVSLLPTPSALAPDAKVSDRARDLYSSTDRLADIVEQSRWGDYAPAVSRWETTIGRPAPAPTETGPKGSPRLSPVFVEFLMGLPQGWVTDVPGLTRNEQLKALGNGVVPQQAAAAVGWLLDQITRGAVA